MISPGPQETYELAIDHHRAGRLAEAESLYRQILARHPDTHEILTLLADILDGTGRPAEAIAILSRVIALRPADANPRVGLGNVYRQTGNLDAAIDAYRQAVAIHPRFSGALNNLGNALRDAGDLDEAMKCIRRAASIGDDPAAAGNLCFALHFDPGVGPAELHDEHVRWNQRFAQSLFPAPVEYPNARDPNRRIKIGYVSPDFRNHPVGLFMLPLLANHDRAAFEIYCYSDAHPDQLTRRLVPLAQWWRDTSKHSDAELANQIRRDGIDVLVDLAVHSRGSRLLMFARKPTPVQVTYLGYCSTTGLNAMNYRLSDPFLDPPEWDGAGYIEKTIRLHTYWCYQPILDVPKPGPLPALANGFVTFGCMNNFSKVNSVVLATWRQILEGISNARLILHTQNGSHRDRIHADFEKAGIDRCRIEFIGTQPLARYLETYQHIDIALDPFPFPGATTTLDALWAGVPVVSVAGQTAVSRSGLSILSNAGLPELVARDVSQYVAIATELSANLPRMAGLRAALRPMMQSSALTNAPQFARNIESAFRDMWRNWCGA